jgi:hypothetical protein
VHLPLSEWTAADIRFKRDIGVGTGLRKFIHSFRKFCETYILKGKSPRKIFHQNENFKNQYHRKEQIITNIKLITKFDYDKSGGI